MPRPGRLQIVYAALACLTLAVGAHAVWTEYARFPPHFRGFGEVTRKSEVAGWAVNAARPDSRVEVQLYVDGRFAARDVALLPRPDVLAAGRASDANCGYRLALPPLPAGEHEARVYAVQADAPGELRTLRQLGNALPFQTDPAGHVVNPVGADTPPAR
jgi:hypothetical protein